MMHRHKMIRIALFLILLYIHAPRVMGDPTPEQTLSGNISGVLSKAVSPYYAVGNIAVDDGDSLVIEPGVRILFSPGCRFHIGKGWVAQKVYPKVLAVGALEDSIIFCATDSEKGWGGLQFNMSGTNDTLAYVVIKDVRIIQTHQEWSLTPGVISILNSSPLIKNSSIQNNYVENTPLFNFFDYSSVGSQNFDPCAPHLKNCVIRGNQCSEERENGGPVFSSTQATALMENLLIVDNQMGHFIVYGNSTVEAFINITLSANRFQFNPYMSVGWGTGSTLIHFENSIIFQNDADFHSLFCDPQPGDMLQFEYCDIDTEIANVYWDEISSQWLSENSIWLQREEIFWGEGNLCQDPWFNNWEGLGYTLSDGSPCVDGGNPQTVYNDYETPGSPGTPLMPALGTLRNDMGAYGGQSELPYRDGISTQIDAATHPKEYMLGDNYPNPFNPETVIPYTLSDQGLVSIKIYNLLGQAVRTLVQTVQTPGSYEVRWDGNNRQGSPMSSGVYFYRIETEQFHATKKMVLLR